MSTPLLRPKRGLPNTALHVAGLSLIWVAAGVFLCALVELIGDGDDGGAMTLAGATILVVGVLCSRYTRVDRVSSAAIFAAVGWTWVIVSLLGALPYIFAGTFRYWDDAIFESISGFSCTGSTVFGGYNESIEDQGQGLLLYRQMTQWFGGMGIVILAVAVLPFLGVGGLSLISAEAPGEGTDRLAPRVSETARRFWILYAGVTALIALALFIAPGMGLYDSIAHAFAAAATGGFSTRNESIGAFDSVAVELVISFGVLLCGASFTLHWRSLTKGPSAYWKSAELRAYLRTVVLAMGFVVLVLWESASMNFTTALRQGFFNVISLATSAGFGSATGEGSSGDFVTWPAAAQFTLLFLMIVGGMTGSTAGGVKMLRLQVGARHALQTLRRTAYPRAVLVVKIGDQPVPDDSMRRFTGFMATYVAFAIVGLVVITALGTDPITALGGVMGSLGNMGPALNEAGPTASFIDGFNRPARLVLAYLMLVGRLELYPMLLLLVAPARAVRKPTSIGPAPKR